MIKMLLPTSTIGIIGAGQLGKMLAQSAQKMGYRVAMFDPNPSSCGFAVSDWHQVGSFDDETAMLDFARKVDVLTYEFENINADILGKLASQTYLPQGTELLLNSQDRRKEKGWLSSLGIPVAPYNAPTKLQDIQDFVSQVGYPVIVKTARLGYDGKGQLRLHSAAEFEAHKAELANLIELGCVVEAFCPFDYEVSVIVARDLHSKVDFFPVSQNQHQHGILYSSQVPSALSQKQEAELQQIAHKIAENGKLVGVCGIEFFVTKSGELLVNELAPRPHNTGHYTMESCNVSQFDQHILAITGRALMPITLRSPAMMINILGQHIETLQEYMNVYPQAMFHLYNKGEAKAQRKMGHFTFLAEKAAQTELLAQLKSYQAQF